jgi:TRAP-type C4-dicarboxylate transport system permease large subunit
VVIMCKTVIRFVILVLTGHPPGGVFLKAMSRVQKVRLKEVMFELTFYVTPEFQPCGRLSL